MKKYDFLIITLVIILSAVIYLFGTSNKDFDVLIYVDGELYEQIDYNSYMNETRNIVSGFGENTVKIDKNGVCVTESTCKDKLDVNSGYINKEGQSIVCLPNRLVIKLQSAGGYDAVTY